MIVITGLSKRFGKVNALAKVNLHVQRGEIFGLVGPDGAGKTTLIRSICGLIEPDQGEIRLLGKMPGEHAKASSRLGYMPQRFSLYGDLSVMENIFFFGAMYGLSKKLILNRAEEILSLTGMSAFKSRLADQLSGGMKQKLALTSALITRPDILVLDEPTYGVDPESRKEFWKILYHLNQEGMTIMVSTPYMDEAELCHRVGFINEGQIKAVDTPANLRSSFGHHIIELRTGGQDPDLLAGLPGLLDISFYGSKYHLVVDDVPSARDIIVQHLHRLNICNINITEAAPSMEDVFMALAENEATHGICNNNF